MDLTRRGFFGSLLGLLGLGGCTVSKAVGSLWVEDSSSWGVRQVDEKGLGWMLYGGWVRFNRKLETSEDVSEGIQLIRSKFHAVVPGYYRTEIKFTTSSFQDDKHIVWKVVDEEQRAPVLA